MPLTIPIKPLVLVGASGAGRSAIMYHLTSTLPHKFNRVISHSTRPPRSNETHNQHFYFTNDQWIESNQKQFITMIRSPHNHYYGLSFTEIHRVYSLNKIPIFKMTLDAYKKNIGFQSIKTDQNEPLPEKKSTLYLLRDKNMECNALYIKVPNFEELERRLRYSPFSVQQQRQKIQSAKNEHQKAERYFCEADIIESGDIQETLIRVKSRLFELY